MHFFDADGLAGKDSAEVNFLVSQTNASAIGDHDDLCPISADVAHLIRPHLGNGLAAGASVRMSALLATAPQLDAQRLDQIAALPLGGRIRLDPWTDRIELAKTKPIALALASEKRPFEITPFFPYLGRATNAGAEKVALASPPAE